MFLFLGRPEKLIHLSGSPAHSWIVVEFSEFVIIIFFVLVLKIVFVIFIVIVGDKFGREGQQRFFFFYFLVFFEPLVEHVVEFDAYAHI